MYKVIFICDGYLGHLEFEHVNDSSRKLLLDSHHEDSCCESHSLTLDDLTLEDFEGLTFDLDNQFFNKIIDFGIELLPTNGHPIRIPGHGENNGHYSANLHLRLLDKDETVLKSWDIEECQTIEGGY